MGDSAEAVRRWIFHFRQHYPELDIIQQMSHPQGSVPLRVSDLEQVLEQAEGLDQNP